MSVNGISLDDREILNIIVNSHIFTVTVAIHPKKYQVLVVKNPSIITSHDSKQIHYFVSFLYTSIIIKNNKLKFPEVTKYSRQYY